MLFNSYEFLLFLPIVFCLYWLLGSTQLKFQNLLLLISSYIFYSMWDWRFLSLLLISTFSDYFLSQQMNKTSNDRNRKFFLNLSILINLGILGFFKYFNFFIDSWISLWGINLDSSSIVTFEVVLPVGISFYTFQTLSYTIDVYKRKIKPADSIIHFSVFVALFPQLVAGPIERAKNLIPQISRRRVFSFNYFKFFLFRLMSFNYIVVFK